MDYTMNSPPTPRWQKPVGMLAILALIAIWCIAIVSLSPWVGRWPAWIQLPFYLVTGIVWLWLLPMRRMLRWMETGRWR
jgi:membrane protein YdbS with pleckstrin-like domain